MLCCRSSPALVILQLCNYQVRFRNSSSDSPFLIDFLQQILIIRLEILRYLSPLTLLSHLHHLITLSLTSHLIHHSILLFPELNFLRRLLHRHHHLNLSIRNFCPSWISCLLSLVLLQTIHHPLSHTNLLTITHFELVCEIYSL